MKIKFKKLHPDAVVPFKTHDSDFCYDCVAVSEEEVSPNVWKYKLGFAIQPLLTEDYNCLNIAVSARPRSSIWKTGMSLVNAVGTIDEGYTGEVCAFFYHVMPDMPRYKVGDRVVQIYVSATEPVEFDVVDDLIETTRGSGGFGSTGK